MMKKGAATAFCNKQQENHKKLKPMHSRKFKFAARANWNFGEIKITYIALRSMFWGRRRTAASR